MGLKDYIEIRVEAIKKELLLYKKDISPEHLHQFRVEVKKLKAANLLIGYYHKNFNTRKIFKSHQKIFRRSGEIRDYDVRDQLNKERPINSDNSNKCRRQYLCKIKKLKHAIPVYLNTLDSTKKTLLKACKGIHQSEVVFYINQRKSKIKRLLNKENFSKKLHTARKVCKEVVYLSRLNNIIDTKSLKYYDRLQNLIGEWHDEQLLIQSLQKEKTNKNYLLLNHARIKAQEQLYQIDQLRKAIPYK
jgi:CHAD domain-containing protein